MTANSAIKANGLAVLSIVLFGSFAFFQQIGKQGWVSDDYKEVFNNGFVSYTSLSNTLKLCGDGHYTVARILGLPTKLYVGYWLGPVGSHLLQAMLHLACAVCFYRLLMMLRFSRFVAVLSAVIFVVSPWISQAVIWWATMITPAGTLCILISLCIFLREKRTWISMPVICLLVLAGLCFYELWLFVPLLFIFVGMYRELELTDEPLSSKLFVNGAIGSCARASPIIAIVVIWAAAYKLTVPADVRNGHLVLSRMAVVLLSMHARIYWWITLTPWRTGFRDGLKYEGAWSLVLGAGICSLTLILRKKLEARSTWRKLSLGLFVAWGFYVSSKLVFIFAGGVAEHTRQNYGAALGVALACGLVIEFVLAKIQSNAVLRFLSAFLILVAVSGLAVVSAGIRHHYVDTSAAERVAIERLTPIAAKMKQDETLIVCGAGTDTKGELAYFSEGSGAWLQTWLRKVNPNLDCFVVTHLVVDGHQIVIDVRRPPDVMGALRFDSGKIHLFRAERGELLEINAESTPSF